MVIWMLPDTLDILAGHRVGLLLRPSMETPPAGFTGRADRRAGLWLLRLMETRMPPVEYGGLGDLRVERLLRPPMETPPAEYGELADHPAGLS